MSLPKLCDAIKLEAGTDCLALVDDLKPTQPFLGSEITRDIKEHIVRKQKVSNDYLISYLIQFPAPVVVGPDGKLYLINFHHLAKASQELEFDYLYVKVVNSFYGISSKTFWEIMEQNNYVSFTDINGKKVKELPENIESIPDERMRSLSFLIWKKGGYCLEGPWTQIEWAQYFYKNITEKLITVKDKVETLGNSMRGVHYISEDLIDKAWLLTKSEESSDMNGYNQGVICPNSPTFKKEFNFFVAF